MSRSVSAVSMATSEYCSCPHALADAHGLPRGDRFRRQPQGDVASLDQCSVVRWPVSDAVFRFVPGMHSRLHVEIMPLRPSRWPGPRRTLVTAHQRHDARRQRHEESRLNACAERFVRSSKCPSVEQSRRPPRRRASASPRAADPATSSAERNHQGLDNQWSQRPHHRFGEPDRRRGSGGSVCADCSNLLPPGGRRTTVGRPQRTLRTA